MKKSISVSAETLKAHVQGKPEHRTRNRRGRPNYTPTKLVEQLINEALDRADQETP